MNKNITHTDPQQPRWNLHSSTDADHVAYIEGLDLAAHASSKKTTSEPGYDWILPRLDGLSYEQLQRLSALLISQLSEGNKQRVLAEIDRATGNHLRLVPGVPA